MECERLFDGKYKIIKTIGSGGMSKIYLAENVKLHTLWAIKKVSKKMNNTIDLLAEPNILKKLNHPSLPRIFDIVENEENLFIIEDYVEGISLDKLLDKKQKIKEKTVIEWAKQICNVLIYLHSMEPNPIIYRDMKPSNIMLTKDNTIKIVDFGIAREYKKDLLNDTTYIGTRGYAAPEQYGGNQTDARTDIYGLGMTLYHLLTGNKPDKFFNKCRLVRQVDKSLSRGIEYIIARCTNFNPKYRFQTAKEVLDCLNKINKELSILWACRYDEYIKEKYDFTSLLRKDIYNLIINERNDKYEIINELKNNSYDILVITQRNIQEVFEFNWLEQIIEGNPELKVIFIIHSKHKNDKYINHLINIGIYNIILDKDISAKNMYSLFLNPRTKLQAKEYLDLQSTNNCTNKVCEDEIANISNEETEILQLQPNSSYVNEEKNAVSASLNIPNNNTIVFKKLILTIWGNSEFAAEMAYIISKVTNFRVALINLDFLSTKIDYYLNLQNISNDYYKCSMNFNQILDAATQDTLTFDMFTKRSLKLKKLNNLNIVMTNYNIDNYGRYKNKNISKLIEYAYKYFDITILVVNKSILDLYTIMALSKSDYNIAADSLNIDNIRENEMLSSYIEKKYNISKQKIRYIAYEFKKQVNPSFNDLKHQIDKNKYLGHITYQPKREQCRNYNVIFSKQLQGQYFNEYIDILSKFNIIPKRTVIKKFKDWYCHKFNKNFREECIK